MCGTGPGGKEVDIRKKATQRERRKRTTGGNVERGERVGWQGGQRSPSTNDYQINEIVAQRGDHMNRDD